jgi:subtilisin-like proprotein convertase family protein
MRGRSRLLGLGLVVVIAAGLPAGVAQGKLKKRTFSSGNINRAIPDKVGVFETFIASPISVKAWGKLKSVKVAVRITHPDTGDLSLVANNPAIKASTLADKRQGLGGNDDDFGAGVAACNGSVSTVFDDAAPTSILDGVNPFAGSFRPVTPLAPFRGGQIHGKWFLEVGDQQVGNAGVINCWQLKIRYKPQRPPPKPSPGERPPDGIKT